MHPSDLEDSTDEEPGCMTVTEDPLLSLTVGRDLHYLCCRRVCRNSYMTALPYAVCVCVTPCESHLNEVLTRVLQSHSVEACSKCNAPHSYNTQVATLATEPSCRKHKLNTGHYCLPESMSSMEEMLCCVRIPYSPQAGLCFVGRDNIFY